MLAQCYLNSDSEDEDEGEDAEVNNINNGHQVSPLEAPVPSSIQCPPADMQVIIDKTAAYVLKNGKDFENVLRAKNDGRFTFLDSTDPYYRYYKFRVSGQVLPESVATPTPPRVSTPNPAPAPVPKSVQTPTKSTLPTNGNSPMRKISNEKPPGPVSFALTATTAIKSKPALGGSSDEDDSTAKKKPVTPAQSYVPRDDLPLPANFQQANFKLQATATPSLNPPSLNSKLHTVQSSNSTASTTTTTTVDQSDSFIRDTILEQQNVEEKKQAKRGKHTFDSSKGYGCGVYAR